MTKKYPKLGDRVRVVIEAPVIERGDKLHRIFTVGLDGQELQVKRGAGWVADIEILESAPSEGSVAVRHVWEVGTAVYVQAPSGPVCVWSSDEGDSHVDLPARRTIRDYGTVVYEAPE